jgi:predicted transcriptional regulator YdeE
MPLSYNDGSWQSFITAPVERIGRQKTLSLERISFSGTIPSQWEELLRLDSFSIQENKITGQMPEGICQIGNFTYLKADCVDEISCLCCTECF